MSLGDEVLGAEVTAERALGFNALVMAALVEQQIALQRERFAAFIALVRTLAGMTATGEKKHGTRKLVTKSR